MQKNTRKRSIKKSLPEKVFGLLLLVRVIKKGWVVYAVNETFTNSAFAKHYAFKMSKSAPKQGLRVDKALVLEMSLKRAWPLKSSYWNDRPNETPFAEIRGQLFQVFLEKYAYQSWSVVLTPNGKELVMAMPVQNKDVETDVEAFMRYSDWFVPPTATEAGIYSVDELWAIDSSERAGRKYIRKKS